jgi:hypothetical protein
MASPIRVRSNTTLPHGAFHFTDDRDGPIAGVRKAECALITAMENMTGLISFRLLKPEALPVIDSHREGTI